MQLIGYVPEIVSMMIAIILYISALSVLFQQLLSRRKKPQGETLANNGEVKVNE